MRLYTVCYQDKELVAVESDAGKLIPVTQLGYPYESMNDLIDHMGKEDLQELSRSVKQCHPDTGIAKEEVKLCAPIPNPKQDIVCLGVNYDEHMNETRDFLDFKEREATVYFSKRVSRAIGDGDKIPNYDFVDSLDYEVELGVILSKDAKNVRPEDAKAYVFGYTVFNDISARNLQKRHKQWYLGKSLDGYTSMGPCIVTADEIPDDSVLHIGCSVNGQMRQDSSTSFMIQPVAGAISEFSRGLTLQKGTILATGTPAGVALGMKEPKYLRSGDEVVCFVEKIGTLTNTVE